jgi:hypothetical protein
LFDVTKHPYFGLLNHEALGYQFELDFEQQTKNRQQAQVKIL